MAENSRDDDAALGTLRDMVMDIRVAMITTEGTDGAMHSRPMYLQQVEEDGDLWFEHQPSLHCWPLHEPRAPRSPGYHWW